MDSSSLIPLDVDVDYERSTPTVLSLLIHEIVNIEVDLVKKSITKASPLY